MLIVDAQKFNKQIIPVYTIIVTQLAINQICLNPLTVGINR